MADPKKRLPTNVPGDFFVDSTCINCDTCRQLASETFGEARGYSFVKHQPSTAAAVRAATRALLACPTGSIGTLGINEAKTVRQDFPLLLEDEVYYCGFNSPKSFGGNSYFVKHAEGNWLIDSPKFLPYLVERFQQLGGVQYIFLTHRDDVADAARYAAQFGSRRIINRADLTAQPDAEIVLGDDQVSFGADFLVVATPGHTAGHCVLLYKQKFLFTGDHLWWDSQTESLAASMEYCWYSWELQKQSLLKLNDYRFQWILPGHGERVHLNQANMKLAMSRLSQWLEAT